MMPIKKKMVEHMKDMPAPGSRPIEEVRENFAAGQRFWNENGPVLQLVENKTIPGPFGPVPVRHYSPVNKALNQPFLLLFHGGGWVAGSPDTHDYLTRFLAKESGADVISVDYGLSPERHFPDTVSECLAVALWLKKHAASWKPDSGRIAIGGDSAGANLALAVALSLRDSGETWLKFCLLFYAALSPGRESESYRLFSKIEYGIIPDRSDWFWRCYIPDSSQWKNPIAAPLYADLRGLPPMFLASAALDPMRDDTLRLCRKLVNACVPHECKVYPGMIHGFLQFIRKVDTALKAAGDAACALKKTLGAF